MLQSGIIELDVHSMNRAQAKTYIDSQLKRAKKDIYQIKVIHGWYCNPGYGPQNL